MTSTNQPAEELTDEHIARGLAQRFHRVGPTDPLAPQQYQRMTRDTIERFILAGNRVQILMVRRLPPGNEMREAVLAAAALPDEGEAYTY